MEDCSFEPYRFTQPKQAFSTYELLYTKQLGVRIYAKLDFEGELEEPVVKEAVEEVIGEKEAQKDNKINQSSLQEDEVPQNDEKKIQKPYQSNKNASLLDIKDNINSSLKTDKKGPKTI